MARHVILVLLAVGCSPADPPAAEVFDESWAQLQRSPRCAPLSGGRREFEAQARAVASMAGKSPEMIAVLWASSPVLVSRFPAPSGQRELCVEESCFGFACEAQAFLVEGARSRRLPPSQLADREAFVFHDERTRVGWAQDESRAWWSAETRQGQVTGSFELGAATGQ
jgi:hypothetical protein